jgi:hypothetical protein
LQQLLAEAVQTAWDHIQKTPICLQSQASIDGGAEEAAEGFKAEEASKTTLLCSTQAFLMMSSLDRCPLVLWIC